MRRRTIVLAALTVTLLVAAPADAKRAPTLTMSAAEGAAIGTVATARAWGMNEVYYVDGCSRVTRTVVDCRYQGNQTQWESDVTYECTGMVRVTLTMGVPFAVRQGLPDCKVRDPLGCHLSDEQIVDVANRGESMYLLTDVDPAKTAEMCARYGAALT